MEYIVNAISILTVNVSRFFTMTKQFFQSIIDFMGTVGSIVETLWFGVKTLLTGIWNLIEPVFDGTLFGYLLDGFNSLSVYIGYGGVYFISSLLFICIVRIGIGFIFKMFRLNVDYKTMKSKWK